MTDLPFLHPGLFQICYVTRDLDAGLTLLSAVHGIERFRIKRDVASLPGMPEMNMHQAHVFLGELQIELIQPAGGADAIYRDFCPADGSLSHHHFGLWIDDRSEYDGLRARSSEQAIPVAFEIAIPRGRRRDLRRFAGIARALPRIRASGAAGEGQLLRRRAKVLSDEERLPHP